MARLDVLATMLAYSALAIIVCDPSHNFWTGLLAGILIGLAAETHLNSLIFIPVPGSNLSTGIFLELPF